MARHSWMLFALIGGIGCVMTALLAVDPARGLGLLGPVAPSPAAGAEADPFLLFVFRWTATALAGGNLLTIAIASTAFRRGERWAGIALSYWPLMFASHLAMYRWGPMSWVQIVWLALTVPALVAHFARSAPRPAVTGGDAAGAVGGPARSAA